jgi:hypothetical protein
MHDSEIIACCGWAPPAGVHSPKGANFDSRFVSREGAKNAKEKACDGFSVHSLEKVSSATEFRPLCVLRVLRVLRVRDIFAPFGECTLLQFGANFDSRFSSRKAASREKCIFQKLRMPPNGGRSRLLGMLSLKLLFQSTLEMFTAEGDVVVFSNFERTRTYHAPCR